VAPADGRGERSALTAIYFLLPGETWSRWHVLRSDEQWAYVEGGPLELFVVDPASGGMRTHRLGSTHDGHEGAAIVPAGSWQAARPFRGFTLVTCTTGPGFDVADFRFVADDPAAARRMRSEWPHLADML